MPLPLYMGAPQLIATVVVSHAEDWYDEVPTLIDDEGDPLDLSGVTFELAIRPDFDHATSIKLLTSTGGPTTSGISIDDAAAGLVSIRLPRASVRTDLPVGEWRHVFTASGGALGGVREIWRGPLIVVPGKTS